MTTCKAGLCMAIRELWVLGPEEQGSRVSTVTVLGKRDPGRSEGGHGASTSSGEGKGPCIQVGRRLVMRLKWHGGGTQVGRGRGLGALE